MSKQLILALLFITLGLVAWDAVVDSYEWPQDTSLSPETDGQVRAKDDGLPLPPCDKACPSGCCS